MKPTIQVTLFDLVILSIFSFLFVFCLNKPKHTNALNKYKLSFYFVSYSVIL